LNCDNISEGNSLRFFYYTFIISFKNAETYARQLERAFQPNNIASELDVEQCQPLNEIREKIKFFTPIEIANENDTNINLKKAPGYDQINKNKKINLTHIYNAILRTEYVPKQWKRAT